jgi:hypothetical protein
MQFSINGDVSDQPISTDLIAETVTSLAKKGDFFLVLSRDEMTYIQTSGNAESGFILEYQDGSIEEHFSCTNAPLNTGQILETLQRYFTNHDRWKSEFTWEKEDLGSSTTQTNVVNKDDSVGTRHHRRGNRHMVVHHRHLTIRCS